MKIIKANIEHFGKLHSVNILFDENINIIYGGNEDGKTTIANFIRYIFYGVTKKGKTVSVSLDHLKRYTPWSGEQICGSLEIEHNGKNYIVSRKGVRSGAQITDLQSGDTVKDVLCEAGEWFSGLNFSAFERSMFVGQEDIRFSTNQELADKLQNMSTTGDEDISIEKSITRLEDCRREIRNARGGGRLPLLEKQCEELNERLKYAQKIQEQILTLSLEREQLEKALLEYNDELKISKQQTEQKRAITAQNTISELEETIGKRDKMAQELTRIQTQKNAYNVKCEYADIPKFVELTYKIQGQQDIADILNESLKESEIQIKQIEEDIKKEQLKIDELEKAHKIHKSKNNKQKTLKTVLLSISGLSFVIAIICWILAFAQAAFPLSIVGVAILIITLIFVGKSKNETSDNEIEQHYQIIKVRNAELENKNSDITTQMEKLKNVNSTITDAKFSIKQITDNAHDIDFNDVRLELEGLQRLYIEMNDITREHQRLNEAINNILNQNDIETLRKLASTTIDISNEAELDEIDTNEVYEKIRNNESRLAYVQSTLDRLNDSESECEIVEHIANVTEKINKLNFGLKSIGIAIEALEDISAELHNNFAPQFSKIASKFLSEITNNSYDFLQIGSDLVPKIFTSNEFKDLGYFSTSTNDTIYLSLRLSLCEMLTNGSFPLFFDESFCHFDNDRLEHALRALIEQQTGENCKGQLFIFSCHDREQRILENLGIKFQLINLHNM